MMKDPSGKMTAGEFISNRTVLVYFALTLFVIVAGFIMPQSLGARSLQTIIREASLLGIVALGQGIVMLSGGLDISVGNVMFFVIVFGGNLMANYPSWTVPILILCMFVGAVVGLVNGIGVARFKISSIIMTLGTSSILYGCVYILGGGTLSGSAHPAWQYVGKKMVTSYMPLARAVSLIRDLFKFKYKSARNMDILLDFQGPSEQVYRIDKNNNVFYYKKSNPEKEYKHVTI